VRDDVTGIDDLDIVRGFDIARRDYALALLAQVEQRLLAVMQLEYDTLQIEEDVDYVFLHTVDGRVLMQHTADLHFSRRIPGHGRQQDSPQGVAQCVSIASFERLHRDLRVGRSDGLHIDDTRLQ